MDVYTRHYYFLTSYLPPAGLSSSPLRLELPLRMPYRRAVDQWVGGAGWRHRDAFVVVLVGPRDTTLEPNTSPTQTRGRGHRQSGLWRVPDFLCDGTRQSGLTPPRKSQAPIKKRDAIATRPFFDVVLEEDSWKVGYRSEKSRFQRAGWVRPAVMGWLVKKIERRAKG